MHTSSSSMTMHVKVFSWSYLIRSRVQVQKHSFAFLLKSHIKRTEFAQILHTSSSSMIMHIEIFSVSYFIKSRSRGKNILSSDWNRISNEHILFKFCARIHLRYNVGSFLISIRPRCKIFFYIFDWNCMSDELILLNFCTQVRLGWQCMFSGPYLTRGRVQAQKRSFAFLNLNRTSDERIFL